MVQRWRSFTSDDELIAPPLLRAECTSAFARLVHTGRIKDAIGRLEIEKMVRLSIRIVEQAALYPRAFDMPRSLGHAKAYDALYLAAIEIDDAELLTVDRGRHETAARLGIRAKLVR